MPLARALASCTGCPCSPACSCWNFLAPQSPHRPGSLPILEAENFRAASHFLQLHRNLDCPCVVSPCAHTHPAATHSRTLPELVPSNSVHECWKAPEMLLLHETGIRNGPWAAFPATLPVLWHPAASTSQEASAVWGWLFLDRFPIGTANFCLLW